MINNLLDKLYDQFRTVAEMDCTVIINGKEIKLKKGSKIAINKNEIYVDDVKLPEEEQDTFDIRNLAEVSVEITGDVKGVDCTGEVVINGNVSCNVSTNSNITVKGDVHGDIDAGESVCINGNHTGDIDCTSLDVGGDLIGDIDASDDIVIHGDFKEGSIDSSGDVIIGKNS